MNNKYINNYTIAIALGGIFISLIFTSKFDLTELTILLFSFVFIFLVFGLSAPNKLARFISNSKKYYIALCILIPFTLLLRIQISEELPVFVNNNISTTNSSNVKANDFTQNKTYIEMFRTSNDNFIVKPIKTQTELNLCVFSISDVCKNINDNFRNKIQIFSWVIIIFLGVIYFGLFIGVKISEAISINE